MTVLFCNHYPPRLLNIAVDFMTREFLICLGWKKFKNVFVMYFFFFYAVIWPFEADAVSASNNKAQSILCTVEHSTFQSHLQRVRTHMRGIDPSVCAFPLQKFWAIKMLLFVKLESLVYFNPLRQSLVNAEVYIVFVVVVCCCSCSISFPTAKQRPEPVSPPCGQPN